VYCHAVHCPSVLQTAATLHDQTQQLNKIVDDLNEIEFTMKKATKIIADIGKGIMTDRCGCALAHCDSRAQLA
jgi:SNARE protein